MKKILVLSFVFGVIFISAVFARDRYIKYNLDELARKSEARIKEIDKKLEKIKKEEEVKRKLKELDSLYTEAEALYGQGKYKEAQKLYRRIKRYARDPDVRAAVKIKKRELEKLKKGKTDEARELRRREKDKKRRLKEEKRRKAKEQKEAKKKRVLKQREKRRELRRQKREKERLAKKEALKKEKKGKIKLEDLTYKTEKECLNILNKNPQDKKAYQNLVQLYLLRDMHLEKGKKLYKSGAWKQAINEYNKALAIQPDNKETIRHIRKCSKKLEHAIKK